ncbi:hypothetical protein ACVOMT_08895 [Sphingomonas panni]
MSQRAPTQPLLDDRQGRRAMVWIMAIMIFLTTLSAALGLSTRNAGGRSTGNWPRG